MIFLLLALFLLIVTCFTVLFCLVIDLFDDGTEAKLVQWQKEHESYRNKSLKNGLVLHNDAYEKGTELYVTPSTNQLCPTYEDFIKYER
jgi:hypothetical protein